MPYVLEALMFLISLRGNEVNYFMNKEMDPLKAASNVYKCLNENNKVRILKVVFKPGDVAKMHHHPNMWSML